MYYKVLPEFEENNQDEKDRWNHLSFVRRYWIYVFFVIVEILIIIYYALHSEYAFDERYSPNIVGVLVSSDHIQTYYPVFQDVHVMVFIGFGFIYAGLKYYQWSAIAFNFMMGAFAIQFGIFCIHFWEMVFKANWQKLELDIAFMIRGDFVAATVLVTYGTVIGKFNLGQYLFMTLLEIIFITLNQVICEYALRAIDMGGSMYIHTFGAFFGLSLVLSYKFIGAYEHRNKVLGYYSSTFSFIGTIFLFLFWPSFNAALALGNGKERIIINTYFTIVASVIGTFVLTPMWSQGRLSIDNVLNATISGGVASGACADLMQNVFIAIILGFVVGGISSYHFTNILPWLEKNFDLQDTFGVFNLHGVPGIISALVNALLIVIISPEKFERFVGEYFDVIERSRGGQAAIQIAALGITLGISIASGFIVGKILQFRCFNEIEHLYTDVVNWHFPKEPTRENNDNNMMDIELPNQIIRNN